MAARAANEREPAQQQTAAQSGPAAQGKGKEKEAPVQRQTVAEAIPVAQPNPKKRKTSWGDDMDDMDDMDEDVPLASGVARSPVRYGTPGGPSNVHTVVIAESGACAKLETPLSTERAEYLKAKYWEKLACHSATPNGCGGDRQSFASWPQTNAGIICQLGREHVEYGNLQSQALPVVRRRDGPAVWVNVMSLFSVWEVIMFRDQLSGSAPTPLNRFLHEAWRDHASSMPVRVAALANKIGIPISEVAVLQKTVRRVLEQNILHQRHEAILNLVRTNETGLQAPFKTRLLIALDTWKEEVQDESEWQMIDLAINIANEF
ncbi:hypothetical protein MAPG_04869 [Magnaporthiopsis poae ATCC 64411]|uniref:Uncharacterized protein n=1 Tax=Magnaporthiopsis poae (strain ATCC 64411 / 73-15) TaxID=644358 RepID=A0A0C4DXW2_MAGP6|nr:hypothetical protein MAPG_04869 [Magnaporthiopsis poae ATCC 64411]